MRFIAVWIISFIAFIDAMLISDNERTRKELLSDNGNITCVCNGLLQTERLPRRHLDDIVLGMMGVNSIVTKYPTISDMLKECSNCSARSVTCNSASRTSPHCIEREITMKDIYISDKHVTGGFTAQDIRVPQHVANGSLGRKPRDYQGLAHCTFPKNLKTSYLNCTEYPSSVTCKQMCIFGFTLDEGITREMKCSLKENIWRPRGFQECSPFVDCTMTLVAPGWKSCRYGTAYIPSECSVSCERYEDKEAVPVTTFICDVNNVWTKKLPHCVTSGSGFVTVPSPRIKLHSLQPEPTAKPRKKSPPKIPVAKKEETQKTDKAVYSTRNP